MALRLGEVAPDFIADSSEGIILFHKWIHNHWAVLFSHPGDFTPVCTSELGAVAKMKEEFKRRNTKVLALSVDSVHAHHRWIHDINETQHTTVDFPVIADPHKKVAHLYDMIHPYFSETETVRSVFIIGPDKRIKLMQTYPGATGRNFQEILRVIDSLQLTSAYPVVTPANWENGRDCLVAAALKDEELELAFPKGIKALRPYLRVTPQPEILN
jgi:alkyl hydroperoxide reductase subunit AhpC